MLVASTQASSLLETAGETIFEPAHWRALGTLTPTAGGRGSSWFIRTGGQEWVLRHYRRGGFVGKFLRDSYVWAGEPRVRAFSELRLILRLEKLGLPVPVPIAAAYRRSALVYRCDLITRRIEGAAPLSARLAESRLSPNRWRDVGAVIARFHHVGLDHADLNAHNILLGPERGVSVIDFDRGRLRAAGRWRQDNLARLQRSLAKIRRKLPAGRIDDGCWRSFMSGYES